MAGDDEMFRPKGPFPLYLKDFRQDTMGWTGAERYMYLELLDYLFHQGGYIPDSDTALAARDDANWANFHLMNLQVRVAQIQSEIDASGPTQTLIQIKADLERQIREQTLEYEDAPKRARN